MPDRADASLDAVVTHDLAHLWFGELTGLDRWSDEWVKEGLATWLAERLTGVELYGDVIHADAERGGRIRVSIPAPEVRDPEQPLFTYEKSARLFGMVEHWIGDSTFRDGVQRYVSDNAWTARPSTALSSALEAASDRPVGAVIESFAALPGLPSISLGWDCARSGSSARVTLRMQQSRYRLGERAPYAAALWTVPVCVHLEGTARSRRDCVVLDRRDRRFDVLADRCPAWVLVNPGGKGYYRWTLPNDRLASLVAALPSIAPGDQREIFDALWAMLDSGALGADAYLGLLENLHFEATTPLLESLVEALERIDQSSLGPRARQRFVARVQNLTHWATSSSLERLLGELRHAGRQAVTATRALELADDAGLRKRLREVSDGELVDAGPEFKALVFRARGRDAPPDDVLALIDDLISSGHREQAAWTAAGSRDQNAISKAVGPLLESTCKPEPLVALLRMAPDRTPLIDWLLSHRASRLVACRQMWLLEGLSCDPKLTERVREVWRSLDPSVRVAPPPSEHCAWLRAEIDRDLSGPN